MGARRHFWSTTTGATVLMCVVGAGLLHGCDEPGTEAVTTEPPAATWDACTDVFRCMAETCPKLQPTSAPAVPPPPQLPAKADAACLATCAAEIALGAGRDAAQDLAACASSECGAAKCAAGDVQCFEQCLWQKCLIALTACGHAQAGAGSCGQGLGCYAALPGPGLGAELDCLDGLQPAAVPAFADVLRCLETGGVDLPDCATRVEACACTAPPGRQLATGCGRYFRCPVAGSCSAELCGTAVTPASRAKADALVACVTAAEPACSTGGTGACQEACLVGGCFEPFAACVADPCTPSAQPGSGTCEAGAACMSACAGTLNCCHSQCAAALSPTAWAAWQALRRCELDHCACAGLDADACRAGPCQAAWQACAP